MAEPMEFLTDSDKIASLDAQVMLHELDCRYHDDCALSQDHLVD